MIQDFAQSSRVKGSTWSYNYISELYIQVVLYFAPLFTWLSIKSRLSNKCISSWPNYVENPQNNNIGKTKHYHTYCVIEFLLCLIEDLSEIGL